MLGRGFNGEKFRFGFNTQEKVTELGADIYTAEFWMYNSQLGRRWNVDPKSNLWESQYSVLGNNPIWRTDVLGDKWKNPEDGAMAKDINNSLERRKNSLNKVADKFTAKADKLAARGKEESANKFRSKAEEARSGAIELGKAQVELSAIGTSVTIFTFQENFGSSVSNTYMDESGTVVIEYASTENAIHELTHAYQHLSGQIEYVAGSERKANYADLTDEVQAYRRQYFYSPFSVKELETDANIRVKTSKDITTDYVIGLYTIDKNGEEKHPYEKYGKTPLNKPGSAADSK